MSFSNPSSFRVETSFTNSNDSQSLVRSATLPTYTYDQIADFLVYNWLNGASFNIGASRVITVNITALTAAGQQLATWALEAWSMVTGITFSQTVGSAQITFDDNEAGAFAGPDSISGSTIYASSVNVSTDWIASYGSSIDSYSFQTYMHEIGHAMGLDHAGNYNGSANYATDGSGDNHYLNDSWQATVMSYFDTIDNTTIPDWPWGTYLLTPMIADILAMQILYGVAGDLRTGDTVYGEGSTAGGYYDTALDAGDAFTIIDEGGIDSIDFSSETADQQVYLDPESISSVGGLVGNMIIMRDTIIENFYSGAGDDLIKGNLADNILWGGAGTDVIWGQDGDDTLRGEKGEDILRGGAGNDVLNGNGKADLLIGEGGNDILRGGNGKDKLDGGAGDDTLMGGIGRDKLVGGTGADTFVFKQGWAVDRVSDFEDNIDTIRLDSALWGGGLSISQVLDIYGSSNVANNGNGGTHVELNFGGGDILKIHGITDVYALLDDIVIF